MISKAWVIFILVLIISGQFLVLSLFHNVDDQGVIFGNSVIVIGKWNYVSASVDLLVLPSVVNGTPSQVDIVLPNGTSFSANNPSSGFSMRIKLPMTGFSLANGAISGPVPLSQDHPLNVTIAQNVGDATTYVSSIMASNSATSFQGLAVELYPIIIHGDAQVAISGYGVAL
ncbi:MAG TPA: hypothetical protein VFF30_15455 [Nitrososphaerales archaeon]|nr:hypothetical protein [Nitrososphaerales archaeon]